MRTMATASVALLLAASSAGAESRSLVYNGYNLSYEVFDEAGRSAPTLVLIHGLACRASHWAAQIEALRGEARILAIDLLGHGYSDDPDSDYSMKLFADNVAAAMDNEGIRRAVLVGHSMGAAVVRAFARQEPQRLQGAVAVDGLLYVSPAMLEMMAPFANRLDSPDYEQLMKQMVESFFGDGTTNEVKQAVRDSMLGTKKEVAVAASREMYAPSVWEPLEFDVPVAVVMAGRTTIPADYESGLRAEAPDLELTQVEGAGHFVMMEQPDAVNEVIRKLLARLKAGR